MSLNSRVQAAVDKAFLAAGDLVKQGKLTGLNVSSYDFATRKTVSKPQASKSIEVIVVSETVSRNTITANVIFKTINLTNYTSLTIDNIEYGIDSYDDNGFVIEAKLVKEV